MLKTRHTTICLAWCNSAGFTTLQFFQDVADAFCPDKRLWVLIVGFDVMLDGCDQFLHAFENAAANLFPGNFTGSPLDQV
jgi:hypothetical protein